MNLHLLNDAETLAQPATQIGLHCCSALPPFYTSFNKKYPKHTVFLQLHVPVAVDNTIQDEAPITPGTLVGSLPAAPVQASVHIYFLLPRS